MGVREKVREQGRRWRMSGRSRTKHFSKTAKKAPKEVNYLQLSSARLHFAM